MNDMEELRATLKRMKNKGQGFFMIGTDDADEAAEIMRIAAELCSEPKEKTVRFWKDVRMPADCDVEEWVAENTDRISFDYDDYDVLED